MPRTDCAGVVYLANCPETGRANQNRSLGGFVAIDDFRKSVHERFETEFALHQRVSEFLEPAIAEARSLPEWPHIALDMLLVQSYKAHLSVRFVAEIGHTEDAATLARRLLELAVSAGYIGFAEPLDERLPRAKRYLAALWAELPDTAKAHLPRKVREDWTALGNGVTAGPFPSMQKMFTAIDQHGTYDTDYRLLSSIAHGSSSDQIIAYLASPVEVRPIWHIGIILVYASRYYLATAAAWDQCFDRIDTARLNEIIDEIAEWAETTTTLE